MVPSSRTPLRPDRLRALNLPSGVEVGLDEWGRPTWVVESDGESADRRTGGPMPTPPSSAGPTVRQGGAVGEWGTAEEAGRRVEEVVEIWVVQDEWWRSPIHRRYVEVVLEGGAHVVLFEDLTTGEWFMQMP